MSKLKIGLLLDDTIDTPDGVQQYVLTLGSWLNAQGHEVHYLVGESNRTDLENVHSLARNVKVRFNKNRLSIPLPANKKAIGKILEQLDLDILHVQMPYSPFLAGRVINMTPKKTKIIGTFHIVPASWLQSMGARSLKLLSKKTTKQFDKVLSVSSAAQDFAKNVFAIDSTVVPNVVNLTRFRHNPNFRDKLTIVFLGRLVERKGCMHLLKALKQLQLDYKGDYEVVIAGKGPLGKKLKQYVKNQKINNVRFIGFIDESQKPLLLSGADIAVFPSTGGESFGIVLIEAMASGARVVMGGNNIGYSSVLSDHPDLLFDPNDHVAFANRLEHFMEFDKARADAAIWAKEAVKNYDVNLVGRKIIKIYEEQLNG